MSANTDYVQSVIGSLSGTMGNVWDANVSQLVVDDAVEAYGVSAEADATDSAKLHTLLRYYTWLRVEDIHLFTDNEKVAKKREQAHFDAMPYFSTYQIDQGRATFTDDPYSIGQIGSQIYGAVWGNNAAKKAADQMVLGNLLAQQNVDERLKPWLESGSWALGELKGPDDEPAG